MAQRQIQMRRQRNGGGGDPPNLPIWSSPAAHESPMEIGPLKALICAVQWGTNSRYSHLNTDEIVRLAEQVSDLPPDAVGYIQGHRHLDGLSKDDALQDFLRVLVAHFEESQRDHAK